MSELPSGTVTFLFTDLEDSTRLWQEHPDTMRSAMARHDEILQESIAAHDGHVVKMTGDGVHAVFGRAHDAVDVAVVIQRALGAESLGDVGPLRVRIGVHTCEAEYRDGDYYGAEVNRAARLMSVAHGRQIVVSAGTCALVRDASVDLVDLGEHRLRDLVQAERIFEVRAAGLPSGFPPLGSLEAFPGNLPVQVSSFVGREAEITRVGQAFDDARVVTLTGVGGVGKTRLALQVAADALGRFPDGAWLCELAPVSDPGAVWDALAAALRVSARPGLELEQSLLEFLSEKCLLLILDNCEHLLESVARVVNTIVHRCASTSVLATSREGLALDGERLIAVPSLGVPGVDAAEDELAASEAVRLFADRARAANDDFMLSSEAVLTAGILCRRLDGIPLAIELAAARIRSMSTDDLVARLDQRFKLLTRGSRAGLERHQTLRNTIDWSYDLLDATERRALNRVAVFAGGWDLRAAEGVVAADDSDALDVDLWLGQLVEKSLVAVDDDVRTGAVRYRLHESIRQYAQERLEASGETAELRRRHAEYYVAWAEEARPHWRGRDHQEWTDASRREVDNFRAAFDWALDTGSVDHAFRLVAPMTLTGPVGEPALEWALTACALPGASAHELFPDVAGWASWSATRSGDYDRAESLAIAAREADELLGTRHPNVIRAFTTRAFFLADFGRCEEYALEWVELARSLGEPYECAHALTMYAANLLIASDVRALAALEDAVRVARDGGIDSALGFSLGFLAGSIHPEDGSRAMALVDEAIEVATRIPDLQALGGATGMKANMALRDGDWEVALRAGADALKVFLQIGDLSTARIALYTTCVALWLGRAVEPAAVLFGKADSLGSGPRPMAEWSLTVTDATAEALVEQLGQPRSAELAQRGAALTFREAVDYARTEADLLLESDRRRGRRPS